MKPIRFYLIVFVILLCDQVSKWSIMRSLPLGVRRAVLGRFLFLTYTQNTGGAFSLFQAGNGIFIVVALIAIVALIYAYHNFQRRDLLVSTALALALGGAVGNLIDRIRFGYVVDFFDIRVWPIFNVADSAISVGIVMLAVYFIFKRDAPEKAEYPI